MQITPLPALRLVETPKAEQENVDPIRSAFSRGDRDAFAELVQPILDPLYTTCLRILRNATAAEEVCQEALVRALRQSHTYDPARPFRPWLFRIAVNLCRDRLRTVWWQRVLPLQVLGADPRPNPEDHCLSAYRDARIRHALGKLPPKYREALALFHLDDLSYAEMTEITSVSVPALKQRVRRGSKLLRDQVNSMYPDLVLDRTNG